MKVPGEAGIDTLVQVNTDGIFLFKLSLSFTYYFNNKLTFIFLNCEFKTSKETF